MLIMSLSLSKRLRKKIVGSAMKEEMHAIQKNTWELTTLSQNHKAIGVKWVYKIKCTTDGIMAKLIGTRRGL